MQTTRRVIHVICASTPSTLKTKHPYLETLHSLRTSTHILGLTVTRLHRTSSRHVPDRTFGPPTSQICVGKRFPTNYCWCTRGTPALYPMYVRNNEGMPTQSQRPFPPRTTLSKKGCWPGVVAVLGGADVLCVSLCMPRCRRMLLGETVADLRTGDRRLDAPLCTIKHHVPRNWIGNPGTFGLFMYPTTTNCPSLQQQLDFIC